MTTLDTVIASLPDVRLSLGGLLRSLRLRGQLGPLVREALAALVVKDEARRARLSVTVEELQAAADAFRRQQGLNSAEATCAWLASRGLSVDDFEASLEERLLAAKLKQSMTGPQVEEHFSAHRPGLEQLRLTVVLAGRDDLASELLSQVRDDGRDLGDVAREHGLEASRQRLLFEELGGTLASALVEAAPGELVGPVETPDGFAVVVVEERRPAELDAATRQRIQDRLFAAWLSARLGEATITLPRGTAG